ncbi:hypothetical protein BH10PSE17_BH10PSE17_10780 [soil metagenome]
MTSSAPQTLQADFNPLIRPYLVVTIGFTLVITIIGIPLAILWFCGVGQWWAHHYFDKLECRIDERALRFRKGILVQTERTIPLENIQDVTFIEGPILRRFHLSTLKFETAGQSAGQAHDMSLTGIIDADAFRHEILARRQRLKDGDASRHDGSVDPAAARHAQEMAALAGIQRTLEVIAERLAPR